MHPIASLVVGFFIGCSVMAYICQDAECKAKKRFKKDLADRIKGMIEETKHEITAGLMEEKEAFDTLQEAIDEAIQDELNEMGTKLDVEETSMSHKGE